MLLTAAPQQSSVSKPAHLYQQMPCATDTKPTRHMHRQASTQAENQHTCIKEAIAKQKLKRAFAFFASWRSAAHESHVNLQGAARMLQWRKLLRLFKVPATSSLLLSHSSCATDTPPHAVHVGQSLRQIHATSMRLSWDVSS